MTQKRVQGSRGSGGSEEEKMMEMIVTGWVRPRREWGVLFVLSGVGRSVDGRRQEKKGE